MALPELVKKTVEKRLSQYCKEKVPPQFAHQLRVDYRFRGNSVTVYEARPQFDNPAEWGEVVVAQCRFDENKALWTLYWADRNCRWHVYIDIEPSRNFDILLQEIERDPTGIFWG